MNRIEFMLPAGTTVGSRVMRFRVSSAGSLQPTGRAADGEVEDYVVNVIPLQDAVTPTILRPVDFDLLDSLIPVTSDQTPLVEWSFHAPNYFHNIEVKNSVGTTVYTKTNETATSVNVSPTLVPESTLYS